MRRDPSPERTVKDDDASSVAERDKELSCLAEARPKIGDSRPAPSPATETEPQEPQEPQEQEVPARGGTSKTSDGNRRKRRRKRSRSGGETTKSANVPVQGGLGTADNLDLGLTSGSGDNGSSPASTATGRYMMAVHVTAKATQIAVLEGRNLIEHYVSRPQDDETEIDGNIYLGRVHTVLPGMEAAFIDIGTPKNAVLYRGDIRFDADGLDDGVKKSEVRIEDVLKQGQAIICQVTKNPIAHKGARLTQDVSLPGRFVVLIPNSDTYGISKRLPDDERKRLRRILDQVRPAGHGLIVRTAAEGAEAEELQRDVKRLSEQWKAIEDLAGRTKAPALLYREPSLAVRVIREEFNKNYRSVVIDDDALFNEVREYIGVLNPEFVDRVQYYDVESEPLPLFEKHRVHQQVYKALDRKVWLPSGGSLIIERTEALTVIDVNTGKNVGRSNLEETVTKNNVEAAIEIARQLRLRDIGGIIVIDFIDMEEKINRDTVMSAFRSALARDKTRMQVFEISELGLVEMTRKRISEGLVEAMSSACPQCEGQGRVVDQGLLEG